MAALHALIAASANVWSLYWFNAGAGTALWLAFPIVVQPGRLVRMC